MPGDIPALLSIVPQPRPARSANGGTDWKNVYCRWAPTNLDFDRNVPKNCGRTCDARSDQMERLATTSSG